MLMFSKGYLMNIKLCVVLYDNVIFIILYVYVIFDIVF